MKKKSVFLLLAILFGLIYPMAAQEPVTGKYDGHRVQVKYVRGAAGNDMIRSLTYDGVELSKKIDGLEKQITDLKKQINDVKKPGPKPPTVNPAPQTDTAKERRLWELEGENHKYRSQVGTLERQVETLERQVVLLEDSVRSLKESLRLVNHELDSLKRVIPGGGSGQFQSGSHIGVYCSLGSPWLMNDLLSPKKGEIPIWSRQMTLSPQFGLYWGSRSLLQNGSLSLGVGFEYGLMRFSAGMGQNSTTLDSVIDNDNDFYTAYLTCRNLKERATLQYISIPLTLSLGQPHSDRVSGYAQFTLAPSFCVASSLSAEGYYDLEGTYSQWNLTLSEFQPLGFGYNNRIEAEVEKTDVSWFLLTGRIAGGVYVPLCRLSQGKTSPWVMKFGVKLDYSIIPNIPKAKNDDSPTQDVFNATDYITQNNFLSRKVSQFLNPGVEVGIMYILGN